MTEHYGTRAGSGVESVWASRSSSRPVDIIAYAAAAADAFIVGLSLALAYILYHNLSLPSRDEISGYTGLGILFAGTFVLLFYARGAYRPSELARVGTQLVRVVVCGVCLTVVFTFLGFLMKIGEDYSRGTILLFLAICSVLLMTSRVLWAHWIPAATSRGFFTPRRLVLICDSDYPVGEMRALMAESGSTITHVFDIPKAQDLKRWIEGVNMSIAYNADEILVAGDNTNMRVVRSLLDELRALPIPVKLSLDPILASIVACPATKIGAVPAVEVQRPPLSSFERLAKRGFDIAFALCAILVLSPIFLITAIAIKLDDGGPVFFRQNRYGYGNVPFRIVKFRSMSVLEDSGEVKQATRGDARVTRVGRLIRSTSIDELPQFWNVLMGHMSIVGPRPHALVHDERYDQIIARYAFRRHVKPGITGWAQVNGFRGETPTIDSMETRVRHDLWYIHNWSPWLDLKIVLLTCITMLDRTKAY